MAKCLDFASLADERVVIQNPVEATTDYGGQSITWTTENTVWAIIKPITGHDTFAQQVTQSRVTHQFIIRYIAAYSDTADAAKRRITFDSRVFTIRAIKSMDESLSNYGREYQVIYAEENGAEYE